METAEALKLNEYNNWLGWRNKVGRMMWMIVWVIFIRPFPFVWAWRRMIYRAFGAKIHPTVHIYASAWVWAPWNLEMGAYSCLAAHVNVYNVGNIVIGKQVTISQGAYLCPVSHDISAPKFPMICSDMAIEDQVWIATEAFVGGRNIRIGEGAVVAARAAVFESVEPWMVVMGNPAKVIKKRVIKNEA